MSVFKRHKKQYTDLHILYPKLWQHHLKLVAVEYNKSLGKVVRDALEEYYGLDKLK